jgi:hypothetical protein
MLTTTVCINSQPILAVAVETKLVQKLGKCADKSTRAYLCFFSERKRKEK